MLKKTLLSTAVASALLTGASLATAEESGPHSISANVTLASDYTFRGISQTDEHGAIQGGLDYGHESGIYAGIWMSNVDFGGDGSTETDYYGGFAGTFGDSDFGYDVGFIYYDYWNQSDFDYLEGMVALSWKDFGISVNYSDEFGDDGPEYLVVGGSYSFTLMEDISVDLYVGYNDADEDDFWEDGEDSYIDWSVGFGYSWMGLDFGLAYVDTDLDDTDAADARAVFSISKSM